MYWMSTVGYNYMNEELTEQTAIGFRIIKTIKIILLPQNPYNVCGSSHFNSLWSLKIIHKNTYDIQAA